MSAPQWTVSHRQLVSAIIALTLTEDSDTPPVLAGLGYSLVAIELPIADQSSRPFQLDLLLLKEALNLSLLVDCKAGPDHIRSEQVDRYMNTTGVEVIGASNITVERPREHLANPIFFVLPDAEPVLARLLAACPKIASDGWGMIRIEQQRFVMVHDELSDTALSASLTTGWEIELQTLPLERLPYDPDAPRWELADAVLRTLMAFFASGRREFDLEELCASSNELWSFLEAQQGFIRRRIRDEIRTIRRTALKGWLAKVDLPSGREERWRFTRRIPASRSVIVGFARRHQKYVSILRSNGDPRADDFVRIDPEQLTLPLIVPESGAE